MRRLVYGVIVLGLLAGCSSMSVQTDYAAGFDFSQVKTFQYRDSDGTVADEPAPVDPKLRPPNRPTVLKQKGPRRR